MQSTGDYEAACNLFWLNMRFCACPGVPVNQQAVSNLKSQYFDKATHKYPFVVTVIVDKIKDLAAQKGQWRRVSPEEGEHALLLAIAEAIRGGASEDDLRRDLHAKSAPADDNNNIKL
jgi:hypothetical protein